MRTWVGEPGGLEFEELGSWEKKGGPHRPRTGCGEWNRCPEPQLRGFWGETRIMETKWPSGAFMASARKKQRPGLGVGPTRGRSSTGVGEGTAPPGGRRHGHVSPGAAAAGPGAVTRVREAWVQITSLLLLA